MSLRSFIKKCKRGGGVTLSSEQVSSNLGGEQPLNSSPLAEGEFADGRSKTSPDSLVFPREDEIKHVIVSERETIQSIDNQNQLQGNKYAPTSKSKISVLPQGVDMRSNSSPQRGEEAIQSEQTRTLGVQVRGEINSHTEEQHLQSAECRLKTQAVCRTFQPNVDTFNANVVIGKRKYPVTNTKELPCKQDNYNEITNQLDCFGSKEPHNDDNSRYSRHSECNELSHNRENITNNAILRGLNNCSPQKDGKNSCCFTRGDVGKLNCKATFTFAEGATYVANSNNSRKVAFTLAETLITLGIIGVVAALTIPNIVTNYKKKVVETRLAKIYSVLNQALVMSEGKNGPCTTWDYGDRNNHRSSEIMENWWKTYMADYVPDVVSVKKISTPTDDISGNGDYMVFFKDGTALRFEAITSTYLWVVVYVKNGIDLSKFQTTDVYQFNKLVQGRDFFSLRIHPDRKCAFVPNADLIPNYTREQQIEDCKRTQNLGDACLKLIQDNGWKIPDDYPIKF